MTFRLSKRVIKYSCLSCILFVYYMFGIMVSFNSLNLSERLNNKLGLALVLFVLLWMILKQGKGQRKTGYYVLFVPLALSVIFSALLNSSLLLLESTCCGLIIFILLPQLKLDTIKGSYKYFFYPYLLSCIVSLYLYNVSSFNSQGIIYTFLGILLLNFLCLKKKPSIVWYLAIVLVIVILLSLTRSRTSMLAFLITAIITYCYLFVRKITVKSFIIHISTAGGLFVAYEYLMKFFITIFFHKWGNSDLTSNRTAIWDMVFARASFWGHGDEYLLGFDAHNTFLQILDMFGVFAFILIILCIIGVLLKIKQSTHRIIFLNFFLAWILISVFEDLNFFTSRMLPVTMLFLLHVALLFNSVRIKKLENSSCYEKCVLMR